MSQTLAYEHRTAEVAGDCSLCIAVVIPCYRVGAHLPDLLTRIGPEVSRIYCVDDACPDGSGVAAKEAAADDDRICVIQHETNQGVGGAVLTGYRQAIADGADIIVKLDGDGQMDPDDIPALIDPIMRGEADYVKGNRFFNLEDLRNMPVVRLVGNAGLSFLSKLSSGYWHLFDPTNGFTAIHASVAALLPADKLSKRYFFESDMLFRLNTLRAVVAESPLPARYGDEVSNLSIWRALIDFPIGHTVNLFKRIFYNYFLRDFSAASLHLVAGIVLLTWGVFFGLTQWARSGETNTFASAGTVMLAALPVILGFQLLLSFMSYDVGSIPRTPLQRSHAAGRKHALRRS